MCSYCAEAMALEYLFADANDRQEYRDLRNRWSELTSLQEGEAVPAAVAPISAEWLEMEQRWIAGERWDHRQPSDTALVGSWRPRPLFVNSTDEDRAAAAVVLRRYIDWARALPPPGPLLREGGYEKDLTDSFTTLSVAWLLISKSGSAIAVRGCAEPLATSYFKLTDKALELWFQRRAALAWSDIAGFDRLLDAYGTKLRPQLAHYVAARCPPSQSQQARLQSLPMP